MNTKELLETSIIDLLGLQNLPAERRGQLLGRMIQVVQERITNRVIAIMSEGQRQELDGLLARDASSEDIDACMKRAVPNFEAISGQEILKFKREMQENTSAVRSMITEK